MSYPFQGAGNRAQQEGQHDRESDRDQNRLRPIEGRNNQDEGRDGDQRRQVSATGMATAQKIASTSRILHFSLLSFSEAADFAASPYLYLASAVGL